MAPKRLTPRGQAAKPPEADPAPRPKRKKPPAVKRVSSKAGTMYVRNVLGTLVRFSLTSGRDIHLNPRGQRNDLAPVNREEQEDSIFLTNIGLIFEVITPAEAQEIISKQSTNQIQQVPHAAATVLTNERGQPINKVTVDEEAHARDITVAHRHEEQGGRYAEKHEVLERGLNPQRAAVPGSVDNPIPQPPSEGDDPLGGRGVSVDPTQRS